jgi:anti-anti-sigma factor
VQLGDATVVEGLRQLGVRLPNLLSREPSTLVVDLSAMTHLSSATVAALLLLRRRCRARGVAVVLRRPSRRSIDMLRRTGLQGVLPVEGVESRHPSTASSPSPTRSAR